jgi:hypothetical protein
MKRFLAFVLAVIPAVAMADTSVGVRAGTLGLGVEVSYPISQRFGLRINADSYKYSRTLNSDGIDYDGKATLKTASLLADWYPFANNFRISAGPMYNGNKLVATSKPNANGKITVNGTDYQASVEGDVDFKKYVPYAGIGYGRPIGSGLSLIFDFGVVFQGSPKATLTGTCTDPTPGLCATFQSNLAAQQQTANDNLKDFRYYPVVSLGLAYTF